MGTWGGWLIGKGEGDEKSNTRILGIMIEIMHKEALRCVGLVMMQSFILVSVVETCNYGSFVVTVFAMHLFS